MNDVISIVVSLLALVVMFAINCMIYALPVMLGIWLWNVFF